MTKIRHAWRWLRAVRAKAVKVRTQVLGTQVLEHAKYLAPGRWVAIPPRSTVWHHVDANLPPTLFGAAGKGTKSAAARPRAVFNWKSPQQWAEWTVIRLAAGGRRRSVMVPSVGEGQGNATVTMVEEMKGGRAGFLALSPGERAVRVGGAGSFDEAYVDVRRRFELHVSAPPFTVNEDGAVLVEQWCDGPLLSQLPVEQWPPHALAVLGGYGNLTAAEAVTDNGSMWRQLPTLLEQVTLPPWLAAPLADDRVRRLLNAPLVAPGQGDLSPKNIIINAHRDTPMVVDFDTAGWLPVWFDPITIAVRATGGERFEKPVEHALTGALDHIWAAAGIDDVDGLGVSHWLALHAASVIWEKEACRFQGACRLPDSIMFSRTLELRATKMLQQVSGANAEVPLKGPAGNASTRNR